MSAARRVIRAALRDTAADLFTTAVVNLLWLLLNALVVAGPPATLALFYVGNRLAHGEVTDPRDFLAGLRRYFGLGWRWGAMNLLAIAFLLGDIALSGRLFDGPTRLLVQGFYAGVLLLWLCLQLYVLPLLFEQEAPRLGLALRNGLVMLGRNPGFSLGLALLLALVLAAGTIFFLVVVAAGGVLVALVGNHAVLNRLAVGRRL
ncbi:MAG: DUF624 domain-containing protein [Candidatus Promineifilaceae bacterium]